MAGRQLSGTETRGAVSRLALFLIFLCSLSLGVHAQNAAIKTNLVGDATASISLGAEVGLAPRWTMDVMGEFNAWQFNNGKRWKHWLVKPEARYWFCDRWNGHFVGMHVFGGQYNIGGLTHAKDFLGTKYSKLNERRYQGWFVGAGVSYGYDFILNRHWNLEPEIGIGWAYTRFDVFRCAGCGKKVETDKPYNYVGPTKAAINLIYTF